MGIGLKRVNVWGRLVASDVTIEPHAVAGRKESAVEVRHPYAPTGVLDQAWWHRPGGSLRPPGPDQRV